MLISTYNKCLTLKWSRDVKSGQEGSRVVETVEHDREWSRVVHRGQLWPRLVKSDQRVIKE